MDNNLDKTVWVNSLHGFARFISSAISAGLGIIYIIWKVCIYYIRFAVLHLHTCNNMQTTDSLSIHELMHDKKSLTLFQLVIQHLGPTAPIPYRLNLFKAPWNPAHIPSMKPKN